MLVVLLVVAVMILLWRNGCCVKQRLSGAMCPECDKTAEKKCTMCTKYKCELKEAFHEAEWVKYAEGIDETVKVVSVKPEVADKPVVKVENAGQKPVVTVKVPPPPKCSTCPKPVYGAAPYTYYPIYQPLPYGVRY